MKDILVPVSPGELLDKITILRIKVARMSDPAKVANVRLELELRDPLRRCVRLVGEQHCKSLLVRLERTRA